MQITLNNEEIEFALEDYVRSQISISENQEIAIDLKAGRGENGFSATLDIRPAKAIKGKAKPVTRAATPSTETVADEKPQPVKVAEAAPKTASIPETLPESNETEEVDEVAAAIPDAPVEETTEEAPATEPRKGSIFNFAAGAKAGA